MPLAKWRKYTAMNARFFFDTRSVLLSALLLAALPSQAQAQAPLDGRLLGITEQVLQASFSHIYRVSKPLAGPHGLRGLWALANTSVSGLAFETTFFLKNKVLNRIEQRWTATANQCSPSASFTKLVSDMRLKYGAGLASTDSTGTGATQRSEAWVAGDADVLAYLNQSPSQCAILVIYKPHVEEDASTL